MRGRQSLYVKLLHCALNMLRARAIADDEIGGGSFNLLQGKHSYANRVGGTEDAAEACSVE